MLVSSKYMPKDLVRNKFRFWVCVAGCDARREEES
jgi:hypothetical protein